MKKDDNTIMNLEYLYTTADYLSDLLHYFDLSNTEFDTIKSVYIRLCDMIEEIENNVKTQY